MRTLLVTGAAGFIGSNFVRMLLNRKEQVKLVAFDKLTYAGNLANLQDLLAKHPDQLVFVKGDICDPAAVTKAFDDHKVTEVVHFAAESHVDRSILGSGPFVQANVVGTQVMLDVSKAKNVQKFLYVSTDEVYGTLPEDKPEIKFTEETPLQPNSPYSASKAGGDCLVRSYFHTFHMPVLTTRCSNNYGPYHFPEKLIPLFVTNLMEGKKVPLYGDGLNIRDWLYVEDHCDAIYTVLNKGRFGEAYNVGGNNEITNRVITETLIREMGKNWDEVVTYVKDRPGHDRRYAIDATKIQTELGWWPKYKFETAIKTTIQWYIDNQSWWRAIKSGEYLKYYETQYAGR
ncbi:dTDP-glucose 4,6-dehydratase [Humisphaera borealis]|uniref:dTDP-glucose 4,6-dehydratase n=1 Tax=Humisphaera borealis TaxID=2807512 RepID=A0A7M2WS14_9BACT|nr:dTDP-glucose 4,6-dehydratase [Humisphaera borealis]QOV88307.1 dTDP-glucose 4,6-dehydratase [Humisphaera borealis]